MTQSLVLRARRRSPVVLEDRPVFNPSRRLLARLAAALVLVVVAIAAMGAPGWMQARAIRSELTDQLYRSKVPADVAGFYEGRGYRPLWIETPAWTPWRRAGLRLESAELAALTGDRRLAPALEAARSGRPDELVRAELALSLALGRYSERLRATSDGRKLAFVDPDLAQPPTAGVLLARAAASPSLSQHIAELKTINPVHAALQKGLAAYRARWSRLPQLQLAATPLAPGDFGQPVRRLRERLGLPPGDSYDPALATAVRRFQAAHALPQTGAADPATLAALNAGAAHYEALILRNLERARLLPPPAGRRWLLVNPAAGELQLHDGSAVRDAMRVVVGARNEQTPMMAGLMRYVVFNPYWYLPVDMARDAVAPRVVASRGAYLQAARLEVLSDWSDEASVIDPDYIDWESVAAGTLEVRLRQRPGGDNMMGQVKFMLPNELGIYLHDTPDKGAFAAAQRLLSAGCVRVERWADLAAWALGRRPPDPAGLGSDVRVDLPAPVTVYVSYLTVAPGPDGGVVFHPDVYGFDTPAQARADVRT